MASSVSSIRKQLDDLASPHVATVMQKFFKTGPGEYGEGDVFLGIKIPPQRVVAKANLDLPAEQVPRLLASKFHEHRSVGLMIWVLQFQKGDEARQKQIYDLYLAHTRWINNWDLVDLSAPTVIGWLAGRSHRPLTKLAGSTSLWERRIAVVGSYAFIRQGQFDTTLELVRRLLDDEHDLMHKACGWMLREVYKRNPETCLNFLNEHIRRMPRTTLRYAIERCDEPTRRRLMLVR